MSFRRLAGAPLWSVSTLGRDPWARTSSGHNDPGIGGTLVKPCLQVFKKTSFPWEGQNREGQPCRQAGPAKGLQISRQRVSSLHSFFLVFPPTLCVISGMVIIHLTRSTVKETGLFPVFCLYEEGCSE